MVVNREDILKNVKTKNKNSFFHEIPFLHKKFLKIASIGPHEKDMKK